MKRIKPTIFLALTLVIACLNSAVAGGKMQDAGYRMQDTGGLEPDSIRDETLKTQLGILLDQWHRDAADARLEAYLGAMSGNAVFLGTDASEFWTKEQFRVFCKPYFDSKRTWSFHSIERHLYLSPDKNSAWFDELLYTQMGVCRGSGAFIREGGKWKISQYVLTTTVPNSLMKQVTRMKSAEDSVSLFRILFGKYSLKGTFIIYDPSSKTYSGFNKPLWDSGYLPASTFKIPNTLIGLDLGIIDTTYVFRWDGKPRRMKQWEHDMKLQEAFRLSCVPCYQELARKTGVARMKERLAAFDYGSMVVNEGSIDSFWLEGDSRITPRQQVLFLQRLHEGKLPVSSSAVNILTRIMVNTAGEQYVIYGKTGWAIRNGNNYGWFVGWVETSGRTYYFALLAEPEGKDGMKDFAGARVSLTKDILLTLGIIRQ